MKALVTGAGGQIGEVLCRRLIGRGDEVRGLFLLNESDGGLEQLGVEIVRGDITKPETLEGICEGCDKVFHLAARVEEWGRRTQFRETIYDGTRNLLRECAGKADRFIYFSSVAYYGRGPYRYFDENTPPVETGLPYPDMKMLAERLVRTYQAERGLPYTIIRPTQVISPRSAYVRNALDSLLRGPVPLIDGGSYSAGFIYVENLVDGVLLAADSERALNRAYNFCDDYEVTWKEYFTALGELVGKKPAYNLSYRQAYMIGAVMEFIYMPFGKRPLFTRYAALLVGQETHVDTTRAREELGWSTKVPWKDVWDEIERWVRDQYLPFLKA